MRQERSESAREQRTALYKSDGSNKICSNWLHTWRGTDFFSARLNWLHTWRGTDFFSACLNWLHTWRGTDFFSACLNWLHTRRGTDFFSACRNLLHTWRGMDFFSAYIWPRSSSSKSHSVGALRMTLSSWLCSAQQLKQQLRSIIIH